MLRRLFVHAVSTLRPSTLNRQGDGVSHTLARRDRRPTRELNGEAWARAAEAPHLLAMRPVATQHKDQTVRRRHGEEEHREALSARRGALPQRAPPRA